MRCSVEVGATSETRSSPRRCNACENPCADSAGRSVTRTPARPALGCILRQFFKAVAQQRIEIAEQHDGNPGGLGGAACDFDDAVQLDATRQGALAGALNHRAVGCRIAERHAQLDGSGPAARHGDQQFVGGFEVGIAGGDVGHHALAACLAQRFESLLQPGGHCAPPSLSFATVSTSLSPRPDRFTMINPSFAKLFRQLHGVGDGVRGLQRGNDSLASREQIECLQRFGVIGRDVLGASQFAQMGVLRTDGRVIETGADRMGRCDLAVVILQDIAVGSLQHARRSAAESRGVIAERFATTAGLDADETHTPDPRERR